MESIPGAVKNTGHFAYFTVRLRVSAPGEPANLSGIVERLGAGRKRSFPDGQELLRLLTDWSQPPRKMTSATE